MTPQNYTPRREDSKKRAIAPQKSRANRNAQVCIKLMAKTQRKIVGRPFQPGNQIGKATQFKSGHGAALDLDAERKKLLLQGRLRDSEAMQVVTDLSARIADVQERMKFQLGLLEKSYRAECFVKLAPQVLNLIQRLRTITQPSENVESGTVDVADFLPSPTRESFAENSTSEPAQAKPNAPEVDEAKKRRASEAMEIELLKIQVAREGARPFREETPAQRDGETGNLTGIAIRRWGASTKKPKRETSDGDPLSLDTGPEGTAISEPPELSRATVRKPILESRGANERRQAERVKFGLHRLGGVGGTRYGRHANEGSAFCSTDSSGEVVDSCGLSAYAFPEFD